MEEKMKVAVLNTIRNMTVEYRPIPKPKDNEVLVKIKHVGICGSDIHYYEFGRIGDFIVEKPMILGHESSGEVVGLGKNVTGFHIGDLVALEPGIPCGKCEYCKSGRYNLCEDVVFMATPPYDGAFAEYVAYPEDMTFQLPEGMDTAEGALIEPLSVGLHAVNMAKAQMGQTAVILGAGCIGLVTMLSLRALGVTEIYIADVIPKRLEKAKELGATEIIQADETDTVQRVLALTDGKGTDLVFETAGNRVTTQQTADLVKRGGHIVLVGMAADDTIGYNFTKLITKEASINTVFRYRNFYPPAIRAVSFGLIPIDKIVTDVFKFDNVIEAMKISSENKRNIVKAIVKF